MEDRQTDSLVEDNATTQCKNEGVAGSKSEVTRCTPSAEYWGSHCPGGDCLPPHTPRARIVVERVPAEARPAAEFRLQPSGLLVECSEVEHAPTRAICGATGGHFVLVQAHCRHISQPASCGWQHAHIRPVGRDPHPAPAAIPPKVVGGG
eukprot:scaffold40989_cov59-Phaeocystis_antarctica.AAC.2